MRFLRDHLWMSLVMIAVLWFPTVASAFTWMNWDWQDGILHGSNSSMKVKPRIVTEGSNKFLRITNSTGDCSAIPASLCPPKSRALVTFTTNFGSMPLQTDANRRQSYRIRLRFDSNSGVRGSVWAWFQDGEQTGGYGNFDDQGPVARLWRVDDTVYFTSIFASETKQIEVSRKVSANTWHSFGLDAVWSHNASVGRLVFTWNNTPVMTITGRGTNLGPTSNKLPEVRAGMYGDNIPNGAPLDVDDVQIYDTDCGVPASGTSGNGSSCSGPPPPPTAAALWASPTGSGTICSEASPCTLSTMITNHVGGQTLNLMTGTYTYHCLNCLKAGTAADPTILQSVSTSGSPVLVGTNGVSVNPGLATISATNDYAFVIEEKAFITLRNLNITTAGSNITTPAIRIGVASGSITSDIKLENVNVQCPTRTADACIRFGEDNTERISITKSRLHHALGTMLWVRGRDHIIEDNDIYSNGGVGVITTCDVDYCLPLTDRLSLRRNRIFGNTSDAMRLLNGTDQRVSHNLVYANGGGIEVQATAKRIEIYNNSAYDNTTGPGFDIVTGATGILRNNISIGHTGVQYRVPSGVACTHNMAGSASETAATGCTQFSLNAQAALIWIDPNHATLSSRDFRLIATPPLATAIDNGTTGICTSVDTSANRCTPALTLGTFSGTAPDQGARESSATIPPPTTPTVIGDFDFDTDFTDDSVAANHATAVSVTIDTTNKIAGAGAAFLNATTDRISTPITGLSKSAFTIACSARSVNVGTTQYLIGHTSNPGESFADRIQMKLLNNGVFTVGLGDNITALTSTFVFTPNVFYRAVLRVKETSPVSGSGTFRASIDGESVGAGTYSGLTQLAPVAMIGNNGVANTQAWNGQIDECIIRNGEWTDAEVAADCDTFCAAVTPPPDEVLDFDNCTIGVVADNVVSCRVLKGADPAICSPLTDWQVTCDALPKAETACSLTSTTTPRVRITLGTACQATQVVELTHVDFEDPFEVSNQIEAPCGILELDSCATDTTGLLVQCPTSGAACPTVCQTLSNFRMRDNCVAQPLANCSLSQSILQLTRHAPPATPTVDIDLLYVPTDQQVTVTNLFDPVTPTPTTGVHQTQWRFRPFGASDATHFTGRANGVGSVSTGGETSIRVAITNQSGVPLTDFSTRLMCSRQDIGGRFSPFAKVGNTTNSQGLSYVPPSTIGIPDNGPLASVALPLGGGLTANSDRRYRRSEQRASLYTLANNSQTEEEHGISVSLGVALGTKFVCRVHDSAGNALDSYTGLPGCTTGAGPFTSGQHPCGAPFTISVPMFRRQ